MKILSSEYGTDTTGPDYKMTNTFVKYVTTSMFNSFNYSKFSDSVKFIGKGQMGIITEILSVTDSK